MSTDAIHWFPLDVEKSYDYNAAHRWFQQHWTDSFIYSIIYVVLIFAGRKAMHHRHKFDLRMILALWSATLAIFSVIGAIRVLTEYIHTYSNYGLQKTMCDKSYLHGVTGLWCWLFTASKVVELGDTVFIVLRKQKLILLHWYHHISVMIYVFYSLRDGLPHGRYFLIMNYLVHSLMYTYYALKASRLVKIPSYVNIIITSLQLLQMIVGLIVNYYVLMKVEPGPDCPVYYHNIYWSFAMYFSYFVLFCHFFYFTYISPSKKKVHTTKDEKIKTETLSNGLISKKEE